MLTNQSWNTCDKDYVLQSLKHILPDPLQKKLADPCSRHWEFNMRKIRTFSALMNILHSIGKTKSINEQDCFRLLNIL